MLRDDIAAVIDAAHDAYSPYHNDESYPDFIAAKVLAHLGLTEEHGQRYSEAGSAQGEVVLPGVDEHPNFALGAAHVSRLVGPWRVVEEKP